MSNRELKLAKLNLSLTLAQSAQKSAELRKITALNNFAREDAEREIANCKLEVEDLKRQIEALERSE